MKAAVFRRCGGPEQIHLADVPRPEISQGQVLVEVRACALNYFDLLVLGGPAPEGFPFPFWGGADIAGVVAEVGSAVKGFRRGHRVVVNPSLSCGRCEHCAAGEESLCLEYGILGDAAPGGLAEFVAVGEDQLLHLPEGVPFERAAAAPVVFQTAWRALISQARVRPGEDVLILGASGGVGTAAIQIAKLAGAKVFAVTSSAEKALAVRDLGADVALDRSRGDYWAELADRTGGRGVDVVLENVGAATWKKSLESLAKGGRLVTYGRTTGRLGETDIWLLFWHQLRILGTTMASRKEYADVMKLVFDGRLHPVIDKEFPLDQAKAAYERLASGEGFGKVVVGMGRRHAEKPSEPVP